jgi:hypothetical protein
MVGMGIKIDATLPPFTVPMAVMAFRDHQEFTPGN